MINEKKDISIYSRFVDMVPGIKAKKSAYI